MSEQIPQLRPEKTDTQIAEQIGRISEKLGERAVMSANLDDGYQFRDLGEEGLEVHDVNTSISYKHPRIGYREVEKVEFPTDGQLQTHSMYKNKDTGAIRLGKVSSRLEPGKNITRRVSVSVNPSEGSVDAYTHSGSNRRGETLSKDEAITTAATILNKLRGGVAKQEDERKQNDAPPVEYKKAA